MKKSLKNYRTFQYGKKIKSDFITFPLNLHLRTSKYTLEVRNQTTTSQISNHLHSYYIL